VVEDCKFIKKEHLPPSDVSTSDPKDLKAWLTNPHCFTCGNILIDSSTATLEKNQKACDDIRSALKKFSSAPYPIKMPLAPQQLVSFQNHRWIYTLLQNSWSTTMKTILWYCFLTHLTGTSAENPTLAYPQLSKTKLQLSLFQNNVPQSGTNLPALPMCISWHNGCTTKNFVHLS
jgi:hypothetical protein